MSEIVELKLTAMAHGGSALGRHEGRVIFVPYTIPGETVRAEITEGHKRWAKARLLKVLEPSPHRVEPPCPYFGQDACGGCQVQHMAYEAQIAFKQDVVVDQLGRVGGFEAPNVQDIIAAAEPWSYRNNIQFSVTEEGHLGFRSADSHRIVPVDACLVSDSQLDDLWTALNMEWPQLRRLTLRCGSATGDQLAIFELDHYEDFDIEVDFPVSCVLLLADVGSAQVVTLMGSPYLVEHVAGHDYRISPTSFFQVNTGGAEALVALVREHAQLRGTDTLLDLYAGVGLFGLTLAEDFGYVIGVEAHPGAADDFWHNARDLENVELLEGPAEAALAEIEQSVDVIVLDPPRAGAGEEVVAGMVRLSPRRIVYVSCDPATLARDARYLVDAGYRLDSVQPLDMFPQTYHIESVALFVRGD